MMVLVSLSNLFVVILRPKNKYTQHWRSTFVYLAAVKIYMKSRKMKIYEGMQNENIRSDAKWSLNCLKNRPKLTNFAVFCHQKPIQFGLIMMILPSEVWVRNQHSYQLYLHLSIFTHIFCENMGLELSYKYHMVMRSQNSFQLRFLVTFRLVIFKMS